MGFTSNSVFPKLFVNQMLPATSTMKLVGDSAIRHGPGIVVVGP
jgi:hypothetical protein